MPLSLAEEARLGGLIELQRTHLVVRKRSVAREDFGIPDLPDESAAVLADRLLSNDASPDDRLIREEMRSASARPSSG